MLAVPPTAHVLALQGVPLVPHPALRLVPRQLGDDLRVEESNLDLYYQSAAVRIRREEQNSKCQLRKRKDVKTN